MLRDGMMQIQRRDRNQVDRVCAMKPLASLAVVLRLPDHVFQTDEMNERQCKTCSYRPARMSHRAEKPSP